MQSLSLINDLLVQDMEATLVSGCGTETGQIITTSIGGRDGQPKRVLFP